MGEDESKYEVVFVRHGQSTWNKANRFIGWTDTELTEEGEIEARVAGQVRDTCKKAPFSLVGEQMVRFFGEGCCLGGSPWGCEYK